MSLKNTATAALTALALSGGPAAQAEGSSITPRSKSATVEYTQTQAKAVQYVLKRNSKLATLLHQYPSAHSDQFWTAFGEYLDDTDTNAKVAEIIATSGDCNEFKPEGYYTTFTKKQKRAFRKNPAPEYKNCDDIDTLRLNAKISAKEVIKTEVADASQRLDKEDMSLDSTIASVDAEIATIDQKNAELAKLNKALAAELAAKFGLNK